MTVDPKEGLATGTPKPSHPTWPTPKGKTEEEATKKCTENLEKADTYKKCKKVLGKRLDISDAVNQCLTDVLVSLMVFVAVDVFLFQ